MANVGEQEKTEERSEEAPKPSITIVEIPIDDLKPDPSNPRKISDQRLETLTRAIRENGFVEPIVVRAEDNMLVGGHQRVRAARRLGYKTLPAVVVDLPIEKARLLNVTLNKVGGEFDAELLARLLTDLAPLEDIDLSLSGFSDDELKKLLKNLDARDKRERVESFDLDAALEAARAAPRAQRGQIWLLGDHRLMCGDATDAGDVSRLFDGEKAALGALDPPYNVSLGDHGGQQRGQRRRRLENDSLSPVEWESFCRRWARNLLAYVDGAIYICMSTKEWPTVSRILAEEGAHWSDTIVWAKDRFVLGRADYQRQYEPIWYGWREGAQHYWNGDRDQGDVWRIDRPSVSEAHPTQKPLALMERAIENSSRPGDLVYDGFLGSGSSLIACERTGRLCFGIEISEAYASIVLARWEAFTGQLAERLS
jgi:DNA modification methylase